MPRDFLVNPLHGNPLRTREDVSRAVRELFDPLLPWFSPGNARVRLDAAAAHFDRTAADFEGFARPLWGLAPLGAGGGDFAHWDRYAEGIANGTDPSHPEYWGLPRARDQRLVELAAVAFALVLVPEKTWEPLSTASRERVVAYLLDARRCEYADNNWKFFRVLVDIALDRLGASFDRELTRESLSGIESFHVGDGWYRDGNARRMDHYIAFAMHFYGLLHSKWVDDEHAERYRQRARSFAKDFRAWFSDDGGTIPIGRSLTYRFACAGFWGALAFADVEALPWGEIKGLWLRHLRWWADQPIAHRDGVLSIGYGYPNIMMSESYNSAGSPYWAFKAFLPLALPESHPFWAAEETPIGDVARVTPQRHPGLVLLRNDGDVVALASGQDNLRMRFGSEKYAKLAYSVRYAFSVESDERGFLSGAFDSMIAFSDDETHYRVRETNDDVRLAGDVLYARWSPWADVTVETWLVPAPPWHLRVHRVVTPRELDTAEGGFAIARRDADADTLAMGEGTAHAIGERDFSGLVDLGSTSPRRGIVQRAQPNTNLMVAKTLVPQLRARIPKGTSTLVCAVLALPDPAALTGPWARLPSAPDVEELRRLVEQKGVVVTAHESPWAKP